MAATVTTSCSFRAELFPRVQYLAVILYDSRGNKLRIATGDDSYNPAQLCRAWLPGQWRCAAKGIWREPQTGLWRCLKHARVEEGYGES